MEDERVRLSLSLFWHLLLVSCTNWQRVNVVIRHLLQVEHLANFPTEALKNSLCK